MPKENRIEYEVLEDGTISRRVGGAISPLVHGEADDLDEQLSEILGGEIKVTALKPDHGHSHVHPHGHGHTHVAGKMKA